MQFTVYTCSTLVAKPAPVTSQSDWLAHSQAVAIQTPQSVAVCSLSTQDYSSQTHPQLRQKFKHHDRT